VRLTNLGMCPYVVHMANDGLLTTAQAAAVVRVPRRTLIRLVERGEIAPAMKLEGLRGAYLFDPIAVEALAAEREAS
jgi:excisionase family DNA binding protein